MKSLETKTGYPKAFFFTGASLLVSVVVYLIGGVKLISDLFGFFYPAYMSFKAIDTPQESDNTQWLTYWVVFSVFSIVESCAMFITNFIPFYFFIKIAFFLYLYHPKFNGASLIYQQIRPFILPYLDMAKTQKKVN
mmetsp:Transcript_32711/g.46489  ORF Transcript_32711/g.46489 Transcript_32711/m.46489 type:complete len:136 (+) Transcript_32711:463-870(+)